MIHSFIFFLWNVFCLSSKPNVNAEVKQKQQKQEKNNNDNNNQRLVRELFL